MDLGALGTCEIESKWDNRKVKPETLRECCTRSASIQGLDVAPLLELDTLAEVDEKAPGHGLGGLARLTAVQLVDEGNVHDLAVTFASRWPNQPLLPAASPRPALRRHTVLSPQVPRVRSPSRASVGLVCRRANLDSLIYHSLSGPPEVADPLETLGPHRRPSYK